MQLEYRHLNWMQLIWDTGLTTKSKIVCAALTSHMNANHHIAWPSIGRLAAMTGLSERSVIRAIDESEKAGWLSVEHGGINKGTSRYSPIFPPEVEEILGNQPVDKSPIRVTESPNTGDTVAPADATQSPVRVPESHPNQSNESVNNNKRGAQARQAVDKSTKQKTHPQSNTKPPSRKPANDVSRETVAYAASHKPFEDPPAMTAEDKAAAQAQLDAMTKKINGRDSQAINKINKCRFPNRLVTLCKHLGLGDPPPGMDFDEAKTWALRKVQGE